MKSLLNDAYYNNGTSTQYSKQYYASTVSTKTAAFDGTGDTKGITDDSKSLIQEVNWNIKGVFYGGETAFTYYTTTESTSKYNIGLIDPSDYGFATDGGTTTRETCLSSNMGYNGGNGFWYTDSQCKSNSWLYYSNPTSSNIKGGTYFYWTNRPISGWSDSALSMSRGGYVSFEGADNAYGVRPALYLKSGVSIQDISGEDGSYEHPYLVK
jgi:hypothetical protein